MSSEATFHFVANELNVTFECRIDSGSFAPCAWTGNPEVVGGSAGSITYTGLSVGTHTFQVRATDVDGNVGVPAATWSWRVTAPPVLTSVGCSEVVTHSIALDNDLIDCLGVGLIVGANDVTIDLNGHVIDGTGIDAGVLNNGFDSVTVKGGHIHEFDYGVQLNPGSSQNVVTGVRIENNQEAGIGLSDADQNGHGNTIRGNLITGNSLGVGLFAGSRHTVIRDNAFEVNQDDAVHMEGASEVLVTANEMVRNAGAGVFMQGGGDNRVTGNVMTTNLGGGVLAGEELIPSNDNLVEGNTIEESGGPGIAVVDSTGTQVINNDVPESNGAGIELELARNTVVRGNDLRSSGAGIEVSESSNNLIEANNAGSTLGSRHLARGPVVQQRRAPEHRERQRRRGHRGRRLGTDRPGQRGRAQHRRRQRRRRHHRRRRRPHADRQQHHAERRLGHLRPGRRDRRRRQLRRRQHGARPVPRHRVHARRDSGSARHVVRREAARWSATAATRASPTWVATSPRRS